MADKVLGRGLEMLGRPWTYRLSTKTMYIGRDLKQVDPFERLKGRKAPSAFFFLTIVLIAVVFAAPVPGQTGTGCRSDEAASFSFLSGSWKVFSRYRVSQNPERWEETTGSSIITQEFPGCLWGEELQGMRNNAPFRVIAPYSFSNISGKLQHVWAHSQHGALTSYEGVRDGKRVFLEAEFELRGTRIILRRVVELRDGGFEIRSERSLDGGKSWDIGWKLNYVGETFT